MQVFYEITVKLGRRVITAIVISPDLFTPISWLQPIMPGSFLGIGPSVSWSGDISVIGNEEGAVTVDWGVNAAILFGRQKSKGCTSNVRALL